MTGGKAMTDVKALIEDSPVIAAVKDEEGLAHCLRTDVKAVFILFGTVCSIPKIVERVKQSGRAALVHLDLVNGRRASISSANTRGRTGSSAHGSRSSPARRSWASARCSGIS